MKKIRFKHGLKIDSVKCKRCDANRRCVVYQDLYDWRGRLDCGHERYFGMVLPLEELERREYVNYDHGEDPRLTARKQELKRSQQWEAEQRCLKILSEQKFCIDKEECLQNNPFYGHKENEIKSMPEFQYVEEIVNGIFRHMKVNADILIPKNEIHMTSKTTQQITEQAERLSKINSTGLTRGKLYL